MTSVAFNSANEDLVCYSGHGLLNIKSHWFTPYQQRLEASQQGFVVGFMGKCVYILHMYSMVNFEHVGHHQSCQMSPPPHQQCLEIPLTR